MAQFPLTLASAPLTSMAGLNHDFLLLNNTGDRCAQFRKHINDPNAVSLHDDVIDYLWDTLAWIPTENPVNTRMPKGFGLNRWGATAISGKGARVAASVFLAWASLFENGPRSFELTGHWTTIASKPGEGWYSKSRVERKALVNKCRAIAKMASRATARGYWLLHIGV